MNKITKEELRKRFSKGWEVEEVKKPQPIPAKKPMLKDAVADSIKYTSDETFRAIDQLTKVMTDAFNKQVEGNTELKTKMNEVIDRKILVEWPKDTQKKKRWRFTVQRDGRGFIENIIAEEI